MSILNAKAAAVVIMSVIGAFFGAATGSLANCENGNTTQTVTAGQDLSTIIGLSTANCTITVQDGTYDAATYAAIPRIKSGITVKSANGPASTTLRVPSGGFASILLTAGCPTNAILDGFTLTGGYFGIQVGPSTDATPGCAFTGIVLRNLIVDNPTPPSPSTGQYGGHGIHIFKTSDSVIDSCRILKAGNNGIMLDNSSNNNLIINNLVQFTYQQHGIAMQDSTGNQLLGNVISGSAFHGILLNRGAAGLGSSNNRIEFNTVTGQQYDGITISDNSRFNYVGSNLIQSAAFHPINKPVPSPAQGTGIWLNNGSNGGFVFGNRSAGSAESGITVFQSRNTLIEGNSVSANFQNGIYISNDAGYADPGSEAPANTFIFNNRVAFNSIYSLNFRGTSANQVGFNFVSGRREQPGGPLAGAGVYGLNLKTTSNTQVYENTVTSVEARAMVEYDVNAAVFFRNRFLDGGQTSPGTRGITYSISPAQVQWDAYEKFGGNHWAEFAAAGDPSYTTPYNRFVYDGVHGISDQGPYIDKYPFNSESLGRQPAVTVDEPYAGQVLAAGTTKTIHWRAEGCVLVDLQSVSGGGPSIIESNYPNVGYYSWALPSGLAAGSYKMRVTCKNSAGQSQGVSADSDSFSVGNNALALLSPGRWYRAGNADSVWVSWRGAGVSGGVDVYVGVQGGVETKVANAVTGKNFVNIQLPATVSNSDRAIVRIQATGSADQKDSIDGFMTVRSVNAVGFLSPAGGAQLIIGNQHDLRWIGPKTSLTADLDLYRDGYLFRQIAKDLPDYGHFPWQVPEAWSTSCFIRATFKDAAGLVIGTADSAVFSILYVGTPGVLVNRYRLYSPITMEHLFTTDPNEYEVLGSWGSDYWLQEGASHRLYNGPATVSGVDAVPYYRLYDRTKRWHHWTTDLNEYLVLRTFFWVYTPEGVDGYIFVSPVAGSVPLYRLLFPAIAGLHHWTTDENEKNILLGRGWIVEAQNYVFPVASSLMVSTATAASAAALAADSPWLQDTGESGSSEGGSTNGVPTESDRRTAPAPAIPAGAGVAAPAAPLLRENDFDGDGRSDRILFSAVDGRWSFRMTSAGDRADEFGTSGSIPVTGDFDGDGSSDYGVFDAATGLWQLRLSATGDRTDALETPGSIPVTGDFDGDGSSDYGVFDAATGLWQLRLSATGDRTDALGTPGSVPVTGDFDGDGSSDYGTFDPATGLWRLRLSASGDHTDLLGTPGSVPVTGDFDGDGNSDYGTFDPATGLWRLRLSASGDFSDEWRGTQGAFPIGTHLPSMSR